MPDTFVGDLIAALGRRAHALDIALHTVQVSVRGETVAHTVSESIDLDTPQRMYSVSKTVTGLAIGMLADDGALSLDGPITKHFPEMGPTITTSARSFLAPEPVDRHDVEAVLVGVATSAGVQGDARDESIT